MAIESKHRKSFGFIGAPASSLARVSPSTRRSRTRPAETKQVSKETYYRGKRDLLYADF